MQLHNHKSAFSLTELSITFIIVAIIITTITTSSKLINASKIHKFIAEFD